MNVVTARRIGTVAAALVALASAGATNVVAVDPPATIGATVTANVYVDQSRILTVLNRSNVAIVVTAEPSGGWTLEPATPVVLDVAASVQLQVVGTGEDGAKIAIRVRPNQPAPDGQESAQIVLGSRIYLAAPARPSEIPWLLFLVVGFILAGVLAARAYVHRLPRRVQQRHFRSPLLPGGG